MVIWLQDMKKKHIIVCGENLQTGHSGKEDTEAETLRVPKKAFSFFSLRRQGCI